MKMRLEFTYEFEQFDEVGVTPEAMAARTKLRLQRYLPEDIARVLASSDVYKSRFVGLEVTPI
jgi:hypothetical protein